MTKIKIIESNYSIYIDRPYEKWEFCDIDTAENFEANYLRNIRICSNHKIDCDRVIGKIAVIAGKKGTGEECFKMLRTLFEKKEFIFE